MPPSPRLVTVTSSGFMLTAWATSFCSIFARRGSSVSPSDGLHVDGRRHVLCRSKPAWLARFLLVVEHDGVFDPGHRPHDFGERLLLGDFEPLARGGRRFPRAAFVERVFQDRVEVWRQRVGVGDGGQIRRLLAGRHANAIAFALVARKAGLRDRRFDARRAGRRTAASPPNRNASGPAVPCWNK